MVERESEKLFLAHLAKLRRGLLEKGRGGPGVSPLVEGPSQVGHGKSDAALVAELPSQRKRLLVERARRGIVPPVMRDPPEVVERIRDAPPVSQPSMEREAF